MNAPRRRRSKVPPFAFAFAFAFAALGACATGGSHYESLDALSQAIVGAVASEDPGQLKALVASREELEALADSLKLSLNDRGTLIASVEKRRADFDERWAAIVAAAKAGGFALKDVKFERLMPTETTVEKGVTFALKDLDIRVTVKGKLGWLIDVEACIKTLSGWRLADPEVELERVGADD